MIWVEISVRGVHMCECAYITNFINANDFLVSIKGLVTCSVRFLVVLFIAVFIARRGLHDEFDAR